NVDRNDSSSSTSNNRFGTFSSIRLLHIRRPSNTCTVRFSIIRSSKIAPRLLSQHVQRRTARLCQRLAQGYHGGALGNHIHPEPSRNLCRYYAGGRPYLPTHGTPSRRGNG